MIYVTFRALLSTEVVVWSYRRPKDFTNKLHDVSIG